MPKHSQADEKTRVLQRTPQRPDSPATPKTTIYRPQSPSSKTAEVPEPVTGWLVVVAGGGKGKSFTLHYGVNVIGRAAECDVCLDADDHEIARHNQAEVIYDGKGKKFYLRHGEGKNLTYLNDDTVLQPVELSGYDKICLGKTTLLFVPLCGAQFDWDGVS